MLSRAALSCILSANNNGALASGRTRQKRSRSACGRRRTAGQYTVSYHAAAEHNGPARRRGELAADSSPE